MTEMINQAKGTGHIMTPTIDPDIYTSQEARAGASCYRPTGPGQYLLRNGEIASVSNIRAEGRWSVIGKIKENFLSWRINGSSGPNDSVYSRDIIAPAQSDETPSLHLTPYDTPTCVSEPPRIEPQDVLRAAADLVSGPRAEQYGDWRENFVAAAYDAGVTTEDAIRVMIGLKKARLIRDPEHRDSMDDLAAYQTMLMIWQAEESK